jgi:hypothetical protein
VNRARMIARLALLVALAGVVPLLGVGAIAVETMRRRSEGAAHDTLHAVAEQAAARIGGFVAAQREALRAVAAAAGTGGDAVRRLEDAVLDAPGLGRALLVGPETPEAGLPRTLDAAAVARARGGAEVAGEIYLGDDYTPAVDVCVPSRGRPGWAVCAQLDLLELWRFVQHIKVGETGYALAFDGEGRLIAAGAGPLRGAILTGEQVLESAMARAAQRDLASATERYPGPLGEEVLAGWASVADPPWTIVVEQPAREALRAARTALLALAAMSLGARSRSGCSPSSRWRSAGARLAASPPASPTTSGTGSSSCSRRRGSPR